MKEKGPLISKIQRLWRGKKQQENFSSLILSLIEKRVDPASNAVYYYNKKTGNSTWEKPKLLKNSDVEDPPIWSWQQVKGRNRGYYQNRITGDQRWERPLDYDGPEW